MLQKLNERIQGVVAWLVISLIAITFTLFGVDYYLQSQHSSNAKVMVNDEPISNELVETNYRRTRAQQDAAHLTVGDEKNLQAQVINQLITNVVTVQSARHVGFEISASQANTAIVNIPQFQEDGHFSTVRYQQALNSALFTPESFLQEVRQGMLLNQQRFAFVGSSFALPSEVTQFVRLYLQTRDYEYLRIPAAPLEKSVKIALPEIQAYYSSHQQQFKSPEQVSIDYVTLSMHDIYSKLNVSTDEIKRYYNENQSNYLTPAQWRVAHILFALPDDASKEEIDATQNKAETVYKALQEQPALFDQYLARSDDKLATLNKGELPWITAGNNEYDKILSPLTTVGEISAPEKTKHGLEIFKLIEYKPVTTKSLAQVQATIKEQLLTDMAQAEYAKLLEQLSDLSYQTPDSLTPVADGLQIKMEHSPLFSRKGGSDAITSNKQVINAAFSHDVLALGDNSEPVQLNNDSVIVLRVKQHLLAKALPLEKVQEQIKTTLVQNQAMKMAQEIGTQLVNPTNDEQQQRLIASHQLQWNAVTQAARDNDKIDPVINELAFTIVKPENRDGVKLNNGDFVVVKLKNINEGKLDALDEEQKNSLIQQIEASYGMMDYDLYVNSLVHNAKIVRN